MIKQVMKSLLTISLPPLSVWLTYRKKEKPSLNDESNCVCVCVRQRCLQDVLYLADNVFSV